jgi:hypothetical protein
MHKLVNLLERCSDALRDSDISGAAEAHEAVLSDLECAILYFGRDVPTGYDEADPLGGYRRV